MNVTIVERLSKSTAELLALPVAESFIIGTAMLAFLVLCALLIPHALCIILAVFSSLCIGVGVIGFMGILGAELDQISSVAILTSVALSAVFTGHVSYINYCIRSVAASGKRRMATETLSKTAWPILQTAIGAILGVAMLGTVSAYMAKTIFQAICILSVLGVFHGLAVLPVLLWIFG